MQNFMKAAKDTLVRLGILEAEEDHLTQNEVLVALHANRIAEETITEAQWQHLKLWRAGAEARYEQGVGEENHRVLDYLIHDLAVELVNRRGTFDTGAIR